MNVIANVTGITSPATSELPQSQREEHENDRRQYDPMSTGIAGHWRWNRERLSTCRKNGSTMHADRKRWRKFLHQAVNLVGYLQRIASRCRFTLSNTAALPFAVTTV